MKTLLVCFVVCMYIGNVEAAKKRIKPFVVATVDIKQMRAGEAVLPPEYKDCNQIGMDLLKKGKHGQVTVCKVRGARLIKKNELTFICIGAALLSVGTILSAVGLFKLGFYVGKSTKK
uniref:Transmembrane protein n=1 Tax=Panagrellus redivivus TaxID=6233 RepID=A0A7E4VIS2_PANRE